MSVLKVIEKKQKLNILPCYPLTVTDLNESQKQVIKEVNKNNITVVYGAAGTGKTQTIINLIANQLLLNKKVLVVSKMNKAVDVIADRLNDLIGDFTAVRCGDKLNKAMLANKLMDIVGGKVKTQTQPLKLNLSNKNIINLLKNKRAKQLKNLMNDSYARQQLILQSKMLLEKRRKTIVDDFSPILEALPCWCVTTMQIAECLPLIDGLFDLVIIDEASQCDIASCIPCLYRAKKAVVIGDDKQLKHLSFLEKNKEQSFMTKNNVPIELQYIWRYRTNSVFDFANFYADKSIMLNIQYRSPENIMAFSNKEFYNNQLISYKKAVDGAITKILVNGQTDLKVTRNIKEAEMVIHLVKKYIKECPDKTIGILSPFRAQVDLIENMLIKNISIDDIEKHKIVVGTCAAFEGDERDLMLLSWCYADNSHYQTLNYIDKSTGVMNVSITRATSKVINIYSTNNLKDGLLSRYLSSIDNK